MSPDELLTHPPAIERLVTMLIFGRSAYCRDVGTVGLEHWAAFDVGLKAAILRTIRIEGSLLHKKVPNTDLVAHWQELTSVDMKSHRLYAIKDDWLSKVPKALAESDFSG
jgi:hypothetical protein